MAQNVSLAEMGLGLIAIPDAVDSVDDAESFERCPKRHKAFNWEDIKYFLALARRGRLTSAATLLGVNHTTVARRLEEMERSLKTRVFIRTSTGHALTEAGRHLLEFAEEMESTSIRVFEAIGEHNDVLSGVIRIGAPEGFATHFLTSQIQVLLKQYPNLDVELLAGSAFLDVSKREADLAITLARPRVGRIVARKLTDYRVGLYASRKYLKKRPRIAIVSDLAHHPFIGYVDEPTDFPQLDDIRELVPQARVQFRSTSISAQLAAAQDGYGLCMLPSFLAAKYEELVAVLPTEVSFRRTFWLSMHEDLTKVRRMTALRDWLVKSTSEERHLFLKEPASNKVIAVGDIGACPGRKMRVAG